MMTRMRQSVDKSSTKVDFRSYYWDSAFDGSNTRGEGTLNWKGTVNTNAARRNGAGIICYSNTKADSGYSNNPNGGAGCKKDVGNRRWRGQMHWYVRSAAAQCFSSGLTSPRERVLVTTVSRLPPP